MINVVKESRAVLICIDLLLCYLQHDLLRHVIRDLFTQFLPILKSICRFFIVVVRNRRNY